MKRLAHSFWLKLLSLVLALVLWVAIAGEKTSERGFAVPVEFSNLPRDLEVVSGSLNTVDVRLRASPSVMSQLASLNVSAQVDLSDAAEGQRIVHLTPATIHVPFGVRVVKVHPSLLNLALERTVERDVAVKPYLVGEPAPGHEVAEVVTAPPTVRIVGPRTHVEKLTEAFTEPIDVTGLDATRVAENVSVGFDDPILHVEGNSKVKVTAQIREVREERVFDAMPLDVRGGSASVSPATVRVVLRGPASIVRRLTPASVKAYVDAGQLEGVGRLPVAVELAPGTTGVEVESTDPQNVAARRHR